MNPLTSVRTVRSLRSRARQLAAELRFTLSARGAGLAVAPAAQMCVLERRLLLSASPAAALVAPADAAAVVTVESAADALTQDTVTALWAAEDTESASVGFESAETESGEEPFEDGLGNLPSGDFAVVASDDPTTPATPAIDLAAAGTGSVASGLQLVVIDSSVEDSDDLLSGLLASGSDIRLLRLDSERDGLSQITERLERTGPVAAIHLITHGRDGAFQAGSTTVSLETLSEHAAELISWRGSLTADADLLLYGCDVAASDAGRQLAAALASLTGADVAASSDPTGATSLGGDWDLEQSIGSIEETDVSASLASSDWTSTLAMKQSPGQSARVSAVDDTAITSSTDDETTEGTRRGSRNAVASDASGNFVVVWSVTDTSGDSAIRARLFDSSGTPTSSEFSVSELASFDGTSASVAMDADGNFVVVWQSDGFDGSSSAIVFRRFASDGTAISGDTLVNLTTSSGQKNPVIAMNDAGQFLIAWEGKGNGDSNGVFFRRYSAGGGALDLIERRPYGSTQGDQHNPAAGISGDGSAVIVWEGGDSHVYFQRVAADGTYAGSLTQVDYVLTVASNPAVAVTDSGEFTILYRESSLLPGVNGRTYSANGVATSLLGFRVASGDADSPSLAMTDSGSFAVTWQQTGDGDGTGIYARRFLADGTPVSSAFAVNEVTNLDQTAPSVALNSDGEMTFVWTTETDTNGDDVVIRQIANEPPTVSAIADVTIDEDTTSHAIPFTIGGDDIAASLLSLSVTSSNEALVPSGSIVISGDGANRELTITPLPDQSGTSTITVSVSDGFLSTPVSFELTVQSVNDAPVISRNLGGVVAEGQSQTITDQMLSVTDVDDPATDVRFSVTVLPQHGELRREGTVLAAGEEFTQDDLDNNRVSYHHDGSETTADSFSFTVRDRAGATLSERQFEITVNPVNDVPVIQPVSFTVIENSAAGTSVGRVTATDDDPGDSLSWQIVRGNTGGAFQIDAATGAITVASSAALNHEVLDVFDLTVRAMDLAGASSSAVIRITVQDINEAPLVSSLSRQLTEHAAAGTFVGRVSAVDPDAADSLSFAITSGNSGGAFTMDSASGEIRVANPAAVDFESTPTFALDVRVTDAGGLTRTTAATIRLDNVNERPVAGTLPDIVLQEDATPDSINAATVFSDPDGDALRYSANVVAPGSALIKSVRIDPVTGVLDFVLHADAYGTAEIRVTGTDPSGLSAATRFQVQVQPVQDAPRVVSQTVVLTGADSLLVAAPGVLTGAVDPDGDSVTAVLLQAPEHGNLTIQPDGSYTYQPDADYGGLDRFQFAATDGQLTGDPAWVSITVVAPVPVNNTTTTDGGSSTTNSQGDSVSSTTGSPNTGTETVTPTGEGSVAPQTVLPSSAPPDATDSEDGDRIPGLALPGTGSGLSAFSLQRQFTSVQPDSFTGTNRTTDRMNAGSETSSSQLDSRPVSWSPGVSGNPARASVFSELSRIASIQSERFAERLSAQLGVDAQVVGSVGIVTTSFSVGYLFWAVRGGMLLSGLLAQVPAWTMVDPLLVLDGDSRSDDKESLQSLMDRQQARLSSRDPDAGQFDRPRHEDPSAA
jgi:hypothetical protein